MPCRLHGLSESRRGFRRGGHGLGYTKNSSLRDIHWLAPRRPFHLAQRRRGELAGAGVGEGGLDSHRGSRRSEGKVSVKARAAGVDPGNALVRNARLDGLRGDAREHERHEGVIPPRSRRSANADTQADDGPLVGRALRRRCTPQRSRGRGYHPAGVSPVGLVVECAGTLAVAPDHGSSVVGPKHRRRIDSTAVALDEVPDWASGRRRGGSRCD
jgi:hypothetical protein